MNRLARVTTQVIVCEQMVPADNRDETQFAAAVKKMMYAILATQPSGSFWR